MATNNTLTLMHALGWQGGTIHQGAHSLQTSTTDILEADETRMGELLVKAKECRDLINAQ